MPKNMHVLYGAASVWPCFKNDSILQCLMFCFTGSPYRCYVVNVNRIRPIGDNPLSGKFSLMVNTTTKMTFDISQAGPGK